MAWLCTAVVVTACGNRSAHPRPVLRFHGNSVQTLAWWPSQEAQARAYSGILALVPTAEVRRATGLRLSQVVVDRSSTGAKSLSYVFGHYGPDAHRTDRWVTVEETSVQDYPPGASRPGEVLGDPWLAVTHVAGLNISVQCDDRTHDALGILQALVVEADI